MWRPPRRRSRARAITSRTSARPGLDRRELLEGRVGVLGEHPRQRRLPGARRPVEDHRVRLARLDRGPQRRRRPEQVRLADELLERARAHPRRERQIRPAAWGGRRLVGHVEEPSHSAKYAAWALSSLPSWRSCRAGSACSASAATRACGAAARSDGRPAALDRNPRVRGRVRRLQPAARTGEHAAGDLHRATRGRSRRARWSAGSPFILPGLIAVLAIAVVALGDEPPPAIEGFGAGAAAAVAAVVAQAGIELIDPRRGLVYVIAGALGAIFAGPARGRRPAAFCGLAQLGRHTLQSTVWPALILACGEDRRALLRRLLRDHRADARLRCGCAAWMSEQAFANAVAYGQITPGPVTHTIALVGFAAGGFAGALAATAIAFAPKLRDGHARRPPLRAAALQHQRARLPRRRRPGRGRRDPRRRGPARSRARPRLAVGRMLAAAGARAAARPADLVLARAAGSSARHYALTMGLAEELQDETAEVLTSADPLQHGQPARQRARVPGVARGLSGGRRPRGRARRRRARAAEPRRDATKGRGRPDARLPHPRRHRAGRQRGLERRPVGRRGPRRLPLRSRRARHEEPDRRRGRRGRAARPRRRALQGRR